MSDAAIDRINDMTHDSDLRQAYRDGYQDGALSMLAPALGVEPQAGTPTHQLMGRRIRVTIEWIDPISDDHLAVARKMAERSQLRSACRA